MRGSGRDTKPHPVIGRACAGAGAPARPRPRGPGVRRRPTDLRGARSPRSNERPARWQPTGSGRATSLPSACRTRATSSSRFMRWRAWVRSGWASIATSRLPRSTSSFATRTLAFFWRPPMSPTPSIRVLTAVRHRGPSSLVQEQVPGVTWSTPVRPTTGGLSADRPTPPGLPTPVARRVGPRGWCTPTRTCSFPGRCWWRHGISDRI